MKIFITGQPHAGKSTLLAKVVDAVRHKQGFLTREEQEHGVRTGFSVITANGKHFTLATTKQPSPHTVPSSSGATYYVQVAEFEKCFAEVERFSRDDLLYIDEIGRMELYSRTFPTLVQTYLTAPNSGIFVLSSVYEDAFTQTLRNRTDCEYFHLTEQNRETTLAQIQRLLK